MRQAGVELQRSIAGDMAVLAPRMLEYLLDGGEGAATAWTCSSVSGRPQAVDASVTAALGRAPAQ